ncbi:hypothetical protein BDV27DRAFT_139673 [Aspergillus caelatus]|uniref:Uncharacterized protein n=1 Tax=Aspergillus caelatus TaxID=61420 RepID=A0A5N6ZIF0_9EURO|nr:uncharacterized protein BDV27DRAFT_139673 [Aspergillus caelatus]KAE8357265.1 hypothetical protein BDV27DRAFT_139673 [Aspergillus caelatus]
MSRKKRHCSPSQGVSDKTTLRLSCCDTPLESFFIPPSPLLSSIFSLLLFLPSVLSFFSHTSHSFVLDTTSHSSHSLIYSFTAFQLSHTTSRSSPFFFRVDI